MKNKKSAKDLAFERGSSGGYLGGSGFYDKTKNLVSICVK